MNNELIKRATKHRDKIERLGAIVGRCNDAIEEIEHGSDIKINGNCYNVCLKDCHLDDGQKNAYAAVTYWHTKEPDG